MARLELEITGEARKNLDRLCGMLDTKSEVQVLKIALSLLTFYLVETGLGKKIILQDEDGNEEEVLI